LYDKAGRIRFSQNAEQRARYAQSPFIVKFKRVNVCDVYDANGNCTASHVDIVPANEANTKGEVFSFTDYDQETGRILRTGELKICTNVLDFSPIGFDKDETDRQSFLSDLVDDPRTTQDIFTQTLFGLGFITEFKDVTISTYDVPTLNYNNLSQDYLHNRLSSVCNQNACSYFSYDAHGRVKQVVQELKIPTGATTTSSFKTIEYEYNLVSGLVYQVIYQRGIKGEEFQHVYRYDNDNRLSIVTVYSDGGTWKDVATYQYYTHGPLKRTTLGNNVQGLDYVYTLQGWLKSINHPLSDQDPGLDGSVSGVYPATDVFAQMLNYFSGDYSRAGKGLDATASLIPVNTVVNDATTSNYLGRDLYNGNINSIVTRTAFSQTSNATTGGDLMAQRYSYDQLNRLIQSYTELSSATTSTTFTTNWANQPTAANTIYSEKLSYDPNGNINSLNRWASNSTTPLDQLSYTYDKSLPDLNVDNTPRRKANNKLLSVANPSYSASNGSLVKPQNDGNYTYDPAGRLTKDLSTNQQYTWTAYNKLETVSPITPDATTPTLRYTYDPMGKRLSKTVDYPANAGIDVTTWYTYDPSGNVMAVYSQESSGSAGAALKPEEFYMYGSERLGNYTPIPSPAIPPLQLFQGITWDNSPSSRIQGDAQTVSLGANQILYLPTGQTLTNSTLNLNSTGSTLVLEGSIGAGTVLNMGGSNNTILIKGNPTAGSIVVTGTNNTVVVLGTVPASVTLGITGSKHMVLVGPAGNLTTTDLNLQNSSVLDNSGTVSINGTLTLGNENSNNTGTLTINNLVANNATISNSGTLYIVNGTLGKNTQIQGSTPSTALSNDNLFQFEITDHLGNVRAVVSGQKNTDGTAQIVSLKDYFPFGSEMVGGAASNSGRVVTSNAFRYGFGGKENDNEINQIDYENRMYNPQIGRLLSIDAYKDNFPFKSPYSFCNNAPSSRVEIDGLWDIEVHAYKKRKEYGKAVLILKNNKGEEMYRTTVKVQGSKDLQGKSRGIKNGDTPVGTYRIVGWQNAASTGDRRIKYGPNDLLYLEYLGGEGKSRSQMHLHGGRQEVYNSNTCKWERLPIDYDGLWNTLGCIRIMDDEIAELKKLTEELELNDPTESGNYLKVIDDLTKSKGGNMMIKSEAKLDWEDYYNLHLRIMENYNNLTIMYFTEQYNSTTDPELKLIYETEINFLKGDNERLRKSKIPETAKRKKFSTPRI
jgi:RHS repeat-associated protein